MKIRALTLGIPVSTPFDERVIADAARTLRRAQARFEERGFPVDSLRVTTPPVDRIVPSPSEVSAFAQAVDRAVVAHDVTYAGVGPPQLARPDADLDWIDAVADVVLSS
ncbi:MAG: DUF711 family protein, partial [Thermomicrobium sp.]|nr:DUF711 family protein [Thermomicrobium sp.]